MASAPAIVSWSVIVTKSIPRRRASAWTSAGGVAHSGRPSACWTPSLATAEAVEWQCRSTLVITAQNPCSRAGTVLPFRSLTVAIL